MAFSALMKINSVMCMASFSVVILTEKDNCMNLKPFNFLYLIYLSHCRLLDISCTILRTKICLGGIKPYTFCNEYHVCHYKLPCIFVFGIALMFCFHGFKD